MRIIRILVCFLVLVFSHLALASIYSTEDSTHVSNIKPSRIYVTTRLTTTEPVIDGILDDAAWQTGEWAGDFTQWIPNEGAKPSHPTQLKILYDNENIYVAIRAFDSEPDKISRKLGRRDILQGDMAGINFDSYHDHRTGFEFNMTAAGQKIDLLLFNPLSWDVSWDAVWYGKTALEDSAWTIEYKIPLSQLRYSDEDEQIWGLHCWRWIDRLQEESDWEPQSSTGPGILFQFGELHGISGLPKSHRFEIMPYSLGKLNTFKKDQSNPFANDGYTTEGSLGLDAKIGLSSNFTANITINPDFGQVEADPSEINLTAFETFFDEKRPFFLEGINIFTFNTDDATLFYSRRIGQTPTYRPQLQNGEHIKYPENTTILMATKVSGKTADGLSVGIMESLTAAEYAKTSSSSRKTKRVIVEPLTNYLIGRLQQDFDAGNTVFGGIFTSTNRNIKNGHLEFLNNNAYSAGLDFLHHWNDKEFYIDAKLLGSHINGSRQAITNLQLASARYYQRPDAGHLDFDSTLTRLSGYGGSLKIGKGSKGLWRYSTGLSWHSPGLELNDIGFMQRSDFIKQENEISYFVNRPVSIFRTYSIGLTQYNNWDYSPEHLASGAGLNLYLEFLNKWSFSSSVTLNSETLDTRILRGGPAMLLPVYWTLSTRIQTDPSATLWTFVETNTTRADQNTRFFSVSPGLSIQITNPLKLEVSLDYQSNLNDLQYIETKSWNGENQYILGKLDQKTLGMTFRIDYNFTPELSLQYYGSPFASVGSYSQFKSVSKPKASAYNDRFNSLSVIETENTYQTPAGFIFNNPDFNFNQLRSNLVCRWEYQPGSQLYFVWSQERTDFSQPGYESLSKTLTNLNHVKANNVFLVKLSYWLSI